ncbi:MAG: tetratricopeptide repeat protein [Rhodobacteraceae bacterium]|nr:tetratricopeptide repeat protein [Paracoccaceae bacterium]
MSADSGGSSSSGGTSQSAGVTLASARGQIDAGDYRNALKSLAVIVKAEPRNADAWNLMGFASRKMKQYDNAARYYETALKIDPKHLGALEYQGELFVLTQQYDSARANLKRLQDLCGSCEEAGDLNKALASAGQS